MIKNSLNIKKKIETKMDNLGKEFNINYLICAFR